MAKKRTGLQSEISAIFSGVPLPKKGAPGSEPASPAPKPDGSKLPRPAAPQAPGAAPPTVRPPVQPIPEIPPAKVPVAAAPGQKITQVPTRVARRRKDRLVAPKTGVSSGRQKAAVAMVVILLVVLVIVLVRPFRRPPRRPALLGAAGQAGVAVSRSANIGIDWPVPSVYPGDLRDPMVSGSQQQTTIETPNVLVVKGITYSEDRKYAVIGTQTVQEGDTVQGTKIKIKKINPNSVEFEEDGETWTQPVQNEES